MTGTEMIDMLGLRLEDPDQASFTSATKIKAINIAQRTVVNLVDNAYLTELQEIDEYVLHATNGYTSNAVTAGKATFASLAIDPIRGGVIAIKAFDKSGSAGSYTAVDLGFANIIEPRDAKRLENSYLAGSTTNPVAYIFNETIYIAPTDVEAIEVWYVKNPTAVDANNTECELNIALQESILDFAESQLWKMDNKPDRAGIAYTNATNQIQALNERYQVEKPKGIGTQGRS